jgi:hypothetical protein
MSKMHVGPHQAADLRANGLWNPETMTTDNAEAAASRVASMQPPTSSLLLPDHSAPMKPPVLSEIVIDTSPHIGLPPTKPERPVPMMVPVESAPRMDQNAQPIAGAADLLGALAPEGPWTVRTISSLEGGAPQLPKRLGYRVGPENAQDRENGLHGWIAAAEAGMHNCYLHVAVGPDGKPKLSKDDIVGSRAVWVDVDPDPSRFEQSRAEILSAMRAEEPPFSCIVDSGNGLQGYKFIEPYRIGADLERIGELERRNYRICQSLKERLSPGIKIDSCHSIDHLMRLPETTNFLTEKKLKKGYPPGNRPARIVEWHPELVYRLDDLPSEALPDDGNYESTGAPEHEGTDATIVDVWKDRRFAALSDRTKRIIELGHDPNEPKPDGDDSSRSGWLQTMLCSLLGAGCSDVLARAIITDPRWGISESVLEKKGKARERMILREISRARGWVAQQQENQKAKLLARFQELNASYFVIGSVGGHCRVGEFVEQHGRERLNLMSFMDFANREPQPFIKFAGKLRPFGEAWAKGDNRRFYDRVTFKPGAPPVLTGNVLNLWQGFAIEPKKASWKRMRRHIWEVLANCDPKAFKYIMRWAAWAFQNPDKVAGVALAFRGGQGTGKGVFARLLKIIFGQHGAHTSSLDKVLGRFNSVLQDCCLLYLDEVHLPRGSDALGNFKRMITEPTLQIERKGVDVDSDWPNCLHIIMTGNPEQIAPVESDDRRFAVFEASDRHKDDKPYFDSLYAEIENGGAAAMLHDLLQMNLGDWRPFPAYRNAAHRKQKALNLLPPQALVERLLQDQRLPGASTNRANWCPSHTLDGTGLFDKAFKESCDRRCVDLADAAFRQMLKDCGGKAAHSRDRGQRGWEFLPPGDCRKRWEKHFGVWSWDTAAAETWGAPPPTDRQETIAQAEAEVYRAQERLKTLRAGKEVTDDSIPF